MNWESGREERRERAAAQREESYQGQIEEFRKERREVIVRHADRILQGRRKKKAQQKKEGVGQEEDKLEEQEQDKEAEKELVIRQEVAKIKPITRDMAAVQVCAIPCSLPEPSAPADLHSRPLAQSGPEAAVPLVLPLHLCPPEVQALHLQGPLEPQLLHLGGGQVWWGLPGVSGRSRHVSCQVEYTCCNECRDNSPSPGTS